MFLSIKKGFPEGIIKFASFQFSQLKNQRSLKPRVIRVSIEIPAFTEGPIPNQPSELSIRSN